MKDSLNFDELSSKDPRIKYGHAKKFIALANKDPAALYPSIDHFIDLMQSENRILRWMAIDVIGLMSKVDIKDKIDGTIEELFGFLNAGDMITANHSIAALSEIAQARSGRQQRIAEELLKVEHYDYGTDECRNIALGKVILALDPFFDHLKERTAIIDFMKRQTQNTRNATKRKAEKFLLKKREK